METVMFKVFRSENTGKKSMLSSYGIPFEKGMRILDGLMHVQEKIDPTISFRWNCRAGTCGSCTVRVNGVPKLACKTEVSESEKEIVIEPLKTLKIVKDLVTNAAEADARLDELSPWFTNKNKGNGFFEIFEEEALDVQEMKRCIHCYACFDSCPVERLSKDYIGPKAIVNINSFEMHPRDEGERISGLNKNGLWNCIMSGCCSDVCPQEIKIAENAIPFAKEKSISLRVKH